MCREGFEPKFTRFSPLKISPCLDRHLRRQRNGLVGILAIAFALPASQMAAKFDPRKLVFTSVSWMARRRTNFST